MRSIESTGKTYEEALESGLRTLDASLTDVDIFVVQEGSKGLLGLFGSRPFKLRLTMKEPEEDILADLFASPKPEAPKPAPKAEKPAPRAEKPAAPKAEKPAAPKAPKAPKAEKPVEEKTEEKVSEAPAAEAEKPARKPRNAHRGEKKPRAEKPVNAEAAGKAEKAEKKPLPPKAPAKPLEKPVVTWIEADQVEAESPAGKARAFLQELTHLMGVEVDIKVGNDAENNVFVSMTGDTLGILIGRRGETLDALQYLTSLKVNRGQEGYTRVTLDTENYRAKREDTLNRLANRMANKAVKTGRKVSLEPMNPYERRIIHSALQANEAVDTHSEGDEPNRHVVITLRK